MHWIVIGIGGTCGAISRYGVTRYFNKKASLYPWPIFMVNMIGSLLLGFSVAVLNGEQQLVWRDLFNVGFLGAFTTYSTFNFEVISLVESGAKKMALLYLFLSLIVGPFLAWVGMGFGLK